MWSRRRAGAVEIELFRDGLSHRQLVTRPTEHIADIGADQEEFPGVLMARDFSFSAMTW